MEMSQIRYALAAASHLNFTRAAEDCGVSQPALTKGIKALEGSLGNEIFHREGRGIQLSAFGRSMLPHLQQILREADAAKSLADNYRLLDKAPTRLGVLSTIGHGRLAQFLADHAFRNEGAEVTVNEGSLAQISSMLEADEIDLAVVSDVDGIADRFRTAALYEERYVCVFPKGHRLGSKNAISIGDLSGENYVDRLSCEMREMVVGLLGEMGVDLYARFRSDREDWVQSMVQAGIGFAFMPEYSVTLPGLVQRPLAEPELSRRVVIAAMPGRRRHGGPAHLFRAAESWGWLR